MGNNYINFFPLLFVFLMIFFCIFVVVSSNPIHSVLALICLFLSFSFLLLLVGAEFIAFTYVLVYVGAVLILFLWVVMTMPVKINKAKQFPLFFLLSFLFGIIVLLSSILFLDKSFLAINIKPDSILFPAYISYLKNHVDFQFSIKFVLNCSIQSPTFSHIFADLASPIQSPTFPYIFADLASPIQSPTFPYIFADLASPIQSPTFPYIFADLASPIQSPTFPYIFADLASPIQSPTFPYIFADSASPALHHPLSSGNFVYDLFVLLSAKSIYQIYPFEANIGFVQELYNIYIASKSINNPTEKFIHSIEFFKEFQKICDNPTRISPNSSNKNLIFLLTHSTKNHFIFHLLLPNFMKPDAYIFVHPNSLIDVVSLTTQFKPKLDWVYFNNVNNLFLLPKLAHNLYGYYGPLFILVGLILLVALIGTMVLIKFQTNYYKTPQTRTLESTSLNIKHE